MNIRLCEDTDELRDIAERWLSEVDLEQFSIQHDIETIKNDLDSWAEGEGDIFVADMDGEIVGFIALFAVRSFLGNQKFAVEKYWYCKEEHPLAGARLLMAALNWTKAHQCDHFVASKSYTSQRHESIEKLLTEIGAKPFEKSYILEMD